MKGAVVVTGAGSGMGRAVALSLLHKGRNVILVGRRPEALEETRALAPDPALALVASGDLGQVEGVEAVLARIGAQPLCGIIAAAGGQGDFKAGGSNAAAAEAAWLDALRKNLLTAILLIEAAMDRVENGGRIILIGSTAGLDGQGGPYATAKAALHGYGRDLARRTAPRQITVNTIAPGFVADTEFFDAGGYGDASQMVDGAAGQTLLRDVGRSVDIVSAVEWLLGEGGRWITGQTISVNGGTILMR
ncbi:SDR family oxidoreductase [Sphingobium sp. HBC34]|uniref:SDR family oxidoreductase n=1 Tax=Sphingobium cyanobacteriorum TaxID=3063954 RepID=A0ABT8ZMA9_9SPHN|nr:SDR family oxidoreductase [Sphingobium sp. HBC34]MDO7835606.1 SDR family oxidoreductase [Sphingobium sp. HBC34]